MKRTNTAVWMEKQKRWQIKVQKDGERRSFYSSTPGRTAQREANAKADAWLDEGIHDESARVQKIWEEYLENIKLSSGTSNYQQIKKFGENYILPICGHIKIGMLTEGHLQDVLNKAYKNGCLKPGHQRPGGAEPLSRKTLQGIRATEMNFLKWCRQHKYTTLHPEILTVPAGARYKGKKILQPDALQILFNTNTVIKRKKPVQDDLIYAYRFAVATGVRPGELMGLWYGDIKGRRVDLVRAINQYGEQTLGKNSNAQRSFEMNDFAYEAYQNQVALLCSKGIILNYNTPPFSCIQPKGLIPALDSVSKQQQYTTTYKPI